MSGRKRATSVVYTDDLERMRRQLEQQERQLGVQAAEIRDQTVIRDEIARSGARVRGAIDTLSAQVQAADQRAQLERLQIMGRVQQTMDRVAGVASDVQATQRMVADVGRRVQQTDAAVRQLQQFVADDSARARQERQRILAQVNQNHQEILRNREAIERTNQTVRQGIQSVMERIDSLEERQRLEKAQNAAAMMDQAAAQGAAIPAEIAARVAATEVAQAQQQLEQAATLFEQERFDASLATAANAHDRFATVAAQVEAFRRAFEAGLAAAGEAAARARGAVRFLDSEDPVEVGVGDATRQFPRREIVRTWCPSELASLQQRMTALRQPETAATPQELDEIRREAQALEAEATAVLDRVHARQRQHGQRALVVQAVARAMGAEGFRTRKPRLAEAGNPNSDLVMETDDGHVVTLPIDAEQAGPFEVKFPSENVQANTRQAGRIQQALRQQGVRVGGFQEARRQERG